MLYTPFVIASLVFCTSCPTPFYKIPTGIYNLLTTLRLISQWITILDWVIIIRSIRRPHFHTLRLRIYLPPPRCLGVKLSKEGPVGYSSKSFSNSMPLYFFLFSTPPAARELIPGGEIDPLLPYVRVMNRHALKIQRLLKPTSPAPRHKGPRRRRVE